MPSVSTQTSFINGQPIITLKRSASTNGLHPEFLSATILPGRGMNLLQIAADLPGKGVINLLATPSLDQVTQALEGDAFGNGSFSSFGGAFLVPYANRIRGTLAADGQTITALWNGKALTLPANWKGKRSAAERHSIHGLILARAVDELHICEDNASLSAIIHAGNFNEHWLSSTDIAFRVDLRADCIEYSITAKNVGSEAEPMALGWHPYFSIPSGQRQQARLHIPATKYAEIDNLDDVFPTGILRPVKRTPYDFTAAEGAPLGDQYYDDSLTALIHTNGQAAIDLIDPAACYGLRMQCLSQEIGTVHLYAPADRSFVALEPQYNLGDPFSNLWKEMNTGMVTLNPSQSTTFRVRLQLFTPF